MDIDNIPVWPVISMILGVIYFGWLLFGGTFKRELGPFFLKGVAALRWLWALFLRVIEKTQFSDKDENLPELKVPAWRIWLEWFVIIVPTWLYCLPFLNLGSSLGLPGPEAEYFQTFDQILEFSLKEYGQFPLWNPYFHTGMPYIAHPMLHAYNPFISIPVLLFGVMDGFKIALFLAFIIAGLGMWWLGKEVGLGTAARIWISLMFVFSGVPAVKFIQGHYLMVMAFGWIAFSLAAILAATRYKRRIYICLAALGLALLFFCGNVYYAYYLFYVLTVYVLVMFFKFQKTAIFLKVNWGKLKVLAAIGCLSFGLVAIQLLPLVAYRNYFYKAVNVHLSDSRDIPTIFMDFVSPEVFRPGAYSDELRPEEFYAYVGWWPLLALLLLPLGWSKNNRRSITLFLTLLVFTFLWIDVKDMPWHSIFQTTPFLYQFRYPSRMMVIGVLALIMAGSFGLDALFQKSFKNASWATVGNQFDRLRNMFTLLALAVFMVWSISNLALTSQPLFRTVDTHSEPAEQAMRFLNELDSGIYYIDVTQNKEHAVIGAKIRYKNIFDAIAIRPDPTYQIIGRLIEADAKYLLLADDASIPKDASLIKVFDSLSLYQMKSSLPFAFTVPISTLTNAETKLTVSEVTEANSIRQNINRIEGVVTADTESVLVILSSFSSDWQLTVDGNPTKIYNASGYMAVIAEPGTHYYIFTYQPTYFFVGLFITLTTLFIILVVLVIEMLKSKRQNLP